MSKRKREEQWVPQLPLDMLIQISYFVMLPRTVLNLYRVCKGMANQWRYGLASYPEYGLLMRIARANETRYLHTGVGFFIKNAHYFYIILNTLQKCVKILNHTPTLERLSEFENNSLTDYCCNLTIGDLFNYDEEQIKEEAKTTVTEAQMMVLKMLELLLINYGWDMRIKRDKNSLDSEPLALTKISYLIYLSLVLDDPL
jgi:hypothetical protein